MSALKPPDLFDREAEWGRLDEVWNRRKPDLVFVVGRRRAGKSFLLTRFAQEGRRRKRDRHAAGAAEPHPEPGAEPHHEPGDAEEEAESPAHAR